MFREQFTDAEKEIMYERGEYVFHVPPVPHENWTRGMWINYIGDKGWRPSEKTLAEFDANKTEWNFEL